VGDCPADCNPKRLQFVPGKFLGHDGQNKCNDLATILGCVSNIVVHMNQIEKSYPLSPMQQGMLFNTLYAPHAGTDIEQTVISLSEPIVGAKLRRAWQQLQRWYPPLRTAFHWEEESEPIQNVYFEAPLPWQDKDWQHLTLTEREYKLQELLIEDRYRGFDLSKAPCMRFTFIKCAPAHYKLLWSFHHMILDGNSYTKLMEEAFACYEQLVHGGTVQKPNTLPFEGYINWLQDQDWSAAASYWRNVLQGISAPTPLPTSSTKPNYKHAHQERHLSEAAVHTLAELAHQNSVTLNTIIQGVWAILLSHYSHEEDIVFGAIRNGRRSTIPGAQNIVGIFINTLPIRVRVEPQAQLIPWLQQLREQHIAVRPYEHSPLVKVRSWSNMLANQPLMSSMVNFMLYNPNTYMQKHVPGWENRDVQLFEQTTFDLTLNAFVEDDLTLQLIYDCGRFADSIIAQMLRSLQTLLEEIIAHPDKSLGELNLLAPEEKQQLIKRWQRATPNPPQTASSLAQRFAHQVAHQPNAIALTYHNQALTYEQLNSRANQLAHWLAANGVTVNTPVALYLSRSLEMVVAILAVLKAGGAYVPIDTASPPERLAFILADTQAPLLLTHSDFQSQLPALSPHCQVVCLDQQHNVLAAQPQTNPDLLQQPESLAYIIYTSGSTGTPKGVCISQANVLHLLAATEPLFHFSSQDVWSLFHSYAFDFSVWEMWGALLYGGRLVIVPFWVSRSPQRFHELLLEEQVTILNQTPSAFQQLVAWECQQPPTANRALRLIIFGGEALALQSLRPWLERYGDQQPQLVNMYGITETTVHITYRPISLSDLNQPEYSPIGQPIPHWQLYLLDEQLQPVPPGVPGEIVVGGAGVAQGYLNRPDLTTARFIDNPFAPGRLYRSGDLARMRADGELDYLGRMDQQVKLRGYRIELGEIQAALAQHDGVQNCAVTVQESDKDKRLVAYLVAIGTPTVNGEDLRTYLASRLPSYMIPNHFVFLDELPLTVNGKLDRRALPLVEQKASTGTEAYVAPRTETEKLLAAIWADVLNLPQVSVEADFFALGGHSLLITKSVIQIKRQCKFDLPLKLHFEEPTIVRLAQRIDQLKRLSPPAGLSDIRYEEIEEFIL
jgi:amino acid adenylation domain-containing protein